MKFIVSNKRMLSIAISFLFVYLIAYVANQLDLLVSSPILTFRGTQCFIINDYYVAYIMLILKIRQ